MALGDAFQESTDKALGVLAATPFDPIAPDPKYSGWSTIPRAIVAGGAEVVANLQDVAGAYGKSVAAYGAPSGSVFGQSDKERAQSEAAKAKLESGQDELFRSQEAQDTYGYARYLANDPATAGKAEQILFGLTKGLSKAVGSAVALGPLGGAAVFGTSEGMTTTEELRTQGVDATTAREVGGVTALASGAMLAIPVAGQTIKQTVGYAIASGPAAFIAQQAATSSILERANYADLSKQYDPLDPVGLTIATLLPAGFGAWAMRGYKKGGFTAPAAKDNATVQPKATDAASASVSKAEPIPTPEQVDAAMTHNLTIQKDLHEAGHVADRAGIETAAQLEGLKLEISKQSEGKLSTDQAGKLADMYDQELKATEPETPVGLRDDGSQIMLSDELAAVREQALNGSDTTLGALDADLLEVAADCFLATGASL